MLGALVLLLASQASPAAAVPNAAAPEIVEPSVAESDPLQWYVVPNFSFDTDDGAGFGVRGELAIHDPAFKPYKTAYVVHFFASTRGYHHHRFRFDRTGLGPGGRLRLTGHIAYRQWLNDGYWGMGNDTVRDRAFVGTFESEDPARKRYRYKLFQPFAHFTLRAELSGPWKAFTALSTKWSEVRTYEGSVLEQERPFGIEGGLGAQLLAGILYDTRAPEVSPESGLFLELSARGQPPLPHGAGAFAGVFASARGYFTLFDGFVVATRVMGEYLFGSQVPFFELVHWGGSVPIQGVGGFETMRGVSFGRWRAPGKAVANIEFRIDVIEHTLMGNSFRWVLVPYADAGFVFGDDPGTSLLQRGVIPPIHPAAGLGVRAIYCESFVGRVDVGFGYDPVREGDGSMSDSTTLGIYVVFDHTF